MGLHRDAHHWMFTSYGAECLTCDMHLVLVRQADGGTTRYYVRWSAEEQAVRRGGLHAPACGALLAGYSPVTPLAEKVNQLAAVSLAAIDAGIEDFLKENQNEHGADHHDARGRDRNAEGGDWR